MKAPYEKLPPSNPSGRFAKLLRQAARFSLGYVCSEDQFVRPSRLTPTGNNPRWDSYECGPFRREPSDSIQSQTNVPAGVSALLSLCHPSTIAGLVTFVIVNAIERESNGDFAHIFKKVSERVFPPLTNMNAAFMIMALLFAFWVASTLHGYPSPIFPGAAFAVLRQPLPLPLGVKASTTLIGSASKRMSSASDKIPAIASTLPKREVGVVMPTEFNDREQAVLHTNDAFCSYVNIVEVGQC